MLFPEPTDDHLARPVMIVVQVQDDRVERQALVAPFGAAAADVLEAVEQAIEPGTNRAGFLRQRVRPFVGRAERARSAGAGEIFAEGLRRAPPCALGDRVGELNLICAQDLMHPRLPSEPEGILRPTEAGRICPETNAGRLARPMQ